MEPIDAARSGRFEIPILYVDNHLLIAVKPPNMPVQKDSSLDDDLLSALKRYVAEAFHKPGEAYLGLVHRLDRPVGGTMAFARTSKAAARLSEAFASGGARKTYLAVLEGQMDAPREMEHFLLKDERRNMVAAVPEGSPGAKRARLISEPIAARGGLTLARVTLETGRAHQIRVQHAVSGFPLWGDARYGRGKPGMQLALWSWHLTVRHPTKGEDMTFTSLPPREGAWAEFFDILEDMR